MSTNIDSQIKIRAATLVAHSFIDPESGYPTVSSKGRFSLEFRQIAGQNLMSTTSFVADSAWFSDSLAEVVTDFRVEEPDLSIEYVPRSKLSGSQTQNLYLNIYR